MFPSLPQLPKNNTDHSNLHQERVLMIFPFSSSEKKKGHASVGYTMSVPGTKPVQWDSGNLHGAQT